MVVKKYFLVVSLIIITSLIMSCESSQNDSCSETDNGYDIYTIGQNTGYYNGTFFTSEDYCGSDSAGYGDYLFEYSCDGTINNDDLVECENGCLDGVCVEGSNDDPIEDENTEDNVEDSESSNENQLADGYNISIEEMPTFCEDSEFEGIGPTIPEPLIAGITSGELGTVGFEVKEDRCAGEEMETDKDGNVVARTVLREYYCQDSITIDREDYICSDLDPSYLCRIDYNGLGYCG